MDLPVDVCSRLVPVEIKSSGTVTADSVKCLGTYLGLSGDAWGVLVYGGADSCRRREHIGGANKMRDHVHRIWYF